MPLANNDDLDRIAEQYDREANPDIFKVLDELAAQRGDRRALVSAAREARDAIKVLMVELCRYQDHDPGAVAAGELARRKLERVLKACKES